MIDDPVQINLSVGSTSISYNGGNTICKSLVATAPVTFGANAVTETGTFSVLSATGYAAPSGLSINSSGTSCRIIRVLK